MKTTSTNPMKGGSLRKAVNNAIKRLEDKENIKGALYFYKKSECSCCYGPKEKNLIFTIEGNYSANMGCYGLPYEENGYRINFNQEQEKAVKVAIALTDALHGSGWALTWNGSLFSCMSIVKLHSKS